jgi:hypothetical protein
MAPLRYKNRPILFSWVLFCIDSHRVVLLMLFKLIGCGK